METRRIHTLHRAAVGPARSPQLLFVHGGYATAGCWDVYFLPYFSRLGFDCRAVDLAGHGASDGRDRLDSFGIDDYVDDVLQVMQGIAGPLMLIGHSMGSLVVERVLEQKPTQAAILMAPVPPGGILGATMNIAFRQPSFFGEQARATQDASTATPQTLQTIRDVYYSRETKTDDLIRFGHLFQSESRRAIIDLTMLAMRIGRRRPELPVLVVGGEADAVFQPNLLSFTASRWRAEVEVIPGAGHTLMLDAHWQAAAASIADWIKRQP
ncbi:alpha/beta fold hydrolase [Candidatus Accumulibacter sp. ACC003]|uniref:alpha/beta hydrolase n=1 Tax=Candidatus Accumulibacter sp. ACC003 TaxID=2823334 RepID=UPI0025B9B820|nr:alpha/beta fold hydrolase [Candidatus Accumulibacter sp. ACC003]